MIFLIRTSSCGTVRPMICLVRKPAAAAVLHAVSHFFRHLNLKGYRQDSPRHYSTQVHQVVNVLPGCNMLFATCAPKDPTIVNIVLG